MADDPVDDVDDRSDSDRTMSRELSEVLAEAGVDDETWQRIEDEESLAARRLSSIEAGRRKGGIAGAAMAGAMLALQEIYEGPKNDEPVAISESPDEPDDIDTDGITVMIGDVEVHTELPDID